MKQTLSNIVLFYSFILTQKVFQMLNDRYNLVSIITSLLSKKIEFQEAIVHQEQLLTVILI